VNLPTGILYGPDKAYTIMAQGQLTRAAAYRSQVVAYRNGKPVRMNEVGSVSDSVENNKVAAWYVNQRGIILCHSAPARHQHGRGGAKRQEVAADLRASASRHRQPQGPVRPHRVDP